MKYKFTYTETTTDGDVEVIYNLDTVNATELLTHFTYFMLAASFHPNTIKDSLEEVLGE